MTYHFSATNSMLAAIFAVDGLAWHVIKSIWLAPMYVIRNVGCHLEFDLYCIFSSPKFTRAIRHFILSPQYWSLVLLRFMLSVL